MSQKQAIIHLVESPAFELVTAAEPFAQPTRRVNVLRQTDLTYFKIHGWGWYYLSTVLDDYSRYIVAWRLSRTMAASDVQERLEKALVTAKLDQVLRIRCAAPVPRNAAHRTHRRGAGAPDDARQDRALPSLDDFSPCACPGKNLIQLQSYAFP